MSCTINLKDVTVRAGSRDILKSVSLNVNHSDFITVLGQNGAGKSTMLKAILGITACSTGDVFVHHEKLNEKNGPSIRKKIAYMPQRIDVDRYFPFLVRDVLESRIYCAKKPFEKISPKEKKRIEYIIAEFRLKSILDKPFGVVSGGEKQKAMLGAVMAGDPDILLLDEPNLNLDFYAYRDFIGAVEKLHMEKGITVLFVTHLITHIPEASRKVLVMKGGEIKFEGSRKALFAMKNYLEFIYD